MSIYMYSYEINKYIIMIYFHSTPPLHLITSRLIVFLQTSKPFAFIFLLIFQTLSVIKKRRTVKPVRPKEYSIMPISTFFIC
jgi:hypothetical protein